MYGHVRAWVGASAGGRAACVRYVCGGIERASKQAKKISERMLIKEDGIVITVTTESTMSGIVLRRGVAGDVERALHT